MFRRTKRKVGRISGTAEPRAPEPVPVDLPQVKKTRLGQRTCEETLREVASERHLNEAIEQVKAALDQGVDKVTVSIGPDGEIFVSGEKHAPPGCEGKPSIATRFKPLLIAIVTLLAAILTFAASDAFALALAWARTNVF